MKILTVVGARPQFIKAAPVSDQLRRCHQEFLLHTGQHYDHEMSAIFFEELQIPHPDCNLEIGSGPHGDQTGRMLAGIERVVLQLRPDWVLVYGDTNSTLAGALAAVKLHVPVAHVEAGLRSFDRRMPEEVNRVVADHVSSLCLCPTDAAAAQLAREGIVDGVVVTGDVMYDAFLGHADRARSRRSILDRLGLEAGRFALATLHRAENVDDRERLSAILEGLERSELPVVMPVHPRTRAAMERFGLTAKSVRTVEPVGYLEMIFLETTAEVIVTDSGGVQKEAYFAGRPCVTVRDTTEWTETVTAGWNRLAGSDPATIADAVASFRPSGPLPQLFGDGRAAARVVAALASRQRT